MKKIILISSLFFALQAQAEFKHGLYISDSLGNIGVDVSGKHQDFAAFTGSNPQSITEENANIYDGRISNMRSFGYNLRNVPEVGFGYEFGVYSTKVKIPQQNAALIHDNGSAFTKNTLTGPVDIVVDSPSSYIKTIDIYLGGLYNFAKVKENYTLYVGAGYAKIKGDWYNSYYRGIPGEDPEYGKKGKTKVDGYYTSIKTGVNFNKNYNLELEYAKHKLHADSFRSFNINGSDAEFSRTSLNFIYNF